MAQYDSSARTRGLKLDTLDNDQRLSNNVTNTDQTLALLPQRPHHHSSATSQETITRACATPPIEIPSHHDEADSIAVESAGSLRSSDSFAERYLSERKTSISFNDIVRTSSGQEHNILDSPEKRAKHDSRGRSIAQALSERRAHRPHSESDRAHYDPFTGRHLPEYSSSPPHEQPKIGEARHPLLQHTVDTLARQSRDMQSLTSESTMSPVEEAIMTPPDNPSSPINIQPSIVRHFSSSYESHRPKSTRKASERWRDGEAAPDFFSRAGSLKKSDRDPARRLGRRDTQSSTKSPRSAASSFLRGFSMSSGGDDAAPPAVDAEGATVGEDYVLGKQIGYGGFSIIREVRQMSSQTPGKQRVLAVKIVRKQIDGKTKAENDAAQADFEHEVDLWRLLNHKHVLALEAVYELKEATFCFVPLNVGGTLFDVMTNNRQGVSMEIAASYCFQLASALRYLHLDARVVHRDVKLENCLVDMTQGPPGLLRLCDFGLAEWISNDGDSVTSGSSDPDQDRDRPLSRYFGPSDTSTSAFAGGSLEYAAPEVLRVATASGHVNPYDLPPEKSIVSPAVDVWAMGVCMFALLVGRRPFQDAFQPRVVMRILAGEWNKSALKEKVNDRPYKLVKQCLNVDPLRRPRINDIYRHAWFDDMGVRSSGEGSDAESEHARPSEWRL